MPIDVAVDTAVHVSVVDCEFGASLFFFLLLGC